MIRESGVLAPRRAGVTARVKATRQGTRVALRPGGAGRGRVVAFLAMGLIAGAAGVSLAPGVLARLLGVQLGLLAGLAMPAGSQTPAGQAFLLVGLASWIGGGSWALFTLARAAWGVDVLTVSADRCTVWWGIGRWGHGRRFLAKQAGRIELRGRAGALAAQINGRTVRLTRFGTEADRLWLRDLLQDAASGF